jgi:predicted acetyltransferase
VGYEHAGTRFEIRIPTKTLIYKQRVNDLEIRRITASDEKSIKQVYQTRAQRTAGNLDRSDFIWHRVKTLRRRSTQGFMVVNPSTKKIEGYTYYDQKESVDAPYSLHLTDLVALTPAAGRQLLAFLADHRSMTDQIIYTGSADDPILKLLPERNYTAKLLDHWMLRIVDVIAALKARGYSPCVNAEIHLDVRDDSLPENAGRYELTISNGKARVQSGGRGDIRIDERGLAALYTGHMSPNDLHITGQIAIAPRAKDANRTLDTLAAAFAGPCPWLGDMF